MKGIYSYLGNGIPRSWMPLAMANGWDDARQNVREGQLYRWKVAPLSAVLYLCGKAFWRMGVQ
jgi:hypothetical protein